MHSLTQWESSPTFDPYNPNQIIREPNNININGGPGGPYSSYYFNRQPVTAGMLGALRGFSNLSPLIQSLIVGGLAAVAGYYGYKHLGPKIGLSGPRRRCLRYNIKTRRCAKWSR